MQIPGVGQVTAKKLLRTMKSIHAISEATPAELIEKAESHPHGGRRLGVLSPQRAG